MPKGKWEMPSVQCLIFNQTAEEIEGLQWDTTTHQALGVVFDPVAAAIENSQGISSDALCS